MWGGCYCLMICLGEREREKKRISISNKTRKRGKKMERNEIRSTWWTTNDAVILSFPIYIIYICRSFVDRVLHRIVASTHKHARCQFRWMQKIRDTNIWEEKSLSFMHKQHTVADMLFFLPHHPSTSFLLLRVLLLLLPSRFSYSYIFVCLKKQEITCPLLFLSYTYYIVCYSLG